MKKRLKKVFISSRIEELKEEREAVKSAVLELYKEERLPFTTWRWETASEDIPSGKSPDDVQSENLKKSEVYLLIIGAEYGPEKGISSTHKEFEEARLEFDEDSILIYVKNDEETLLRREERLKRWLKDIKGTYKEFEDIRALKKLVKDRLRGLWQEKFESGAVEIVRRMPTEEPQILKYPIKDCKEYIDKIKISWLRRFTTPLESALGLQAEQKHKAAKEKIDEIIKDIEKERKVHERHDEGFTAVKDEIGKVETICFFSQSLNLAYLEDYKNSWDLFNRAIFHAERLGFDKKFISDEYMHQGDAFYEFKQYDDAIRYYSKAILLDPNNAEAYNNLGVISYKKVEYDNAIEYYNKAVSINSNSSEVFANLGLGYAQKGKFSKALENYNKALKINPKCEDAYLGCGIVYAKKGELNEAIKCFNKVLELNPKDAKAYNNRGTAYDEKGEFGKAMSDLKKALELNPNFADAYNNRGIVYDEIGNYNRAIEDFNKALSTKPDDVEIYNNRGVVYAKKGEFDKAMEDYNKSVELNPYFAVGYINRGNVHLNNKEYDKAIGEFNKAIELNQNIAEVYNNRGAAYSLKGELEKAIEDYDKALTLKPNYAKVYANRSSIYFKEEKYHEALKDAKNAGILFFTTKRVDDAPKAFSIGFKLNEKISDDNIIYCGIFLFVITLDYSVLDKLRNMKKKDELKRIYEFLLAKLKRERVNIEEIRNEIRRDDLKLLLDAIMSGL
jgi:tetratricopeptide (TPR) repeat protein